MKIYYHADDLGQSLFQSQPFLDCHNDGVLNSLAVMTNSPRAKECYELVRTLVDEGEIRPTVHLNFVEGPALSEADEVSDLVDERGYFSLGFIKAVLMGFSFGKKKEIYKAEFKSEIKKQIEMGLSIFKGDKDELPLWGIDSHLHYHMIPIIWKSVCEVIKEEGYKPSWIRISKDPVFPVLTTPSVWKKIPFINVIKWMILKIIGPTRKNVEKMGVNVPVFWGMFSTLRMEKDIVSKLHAKYEKVAKNKGCDLELMFHPGYSVDRNETLDPTRDDLWEANSSEFRLKEQETLKTI